LALAGARESRQFARVGEVEFRRINLLDHGDGRE
jgi:hypothetical protein